MTKVPEMGKSTWQTLIIGGQDEAFPGRFSNQPSDTVENDATAPPPGLGLFGGEGVEKFLHEICRGYALVFHDLWGLILG